MKLPSFKVPAFKSPVVKKTPLPALAKAKDPLKGVKLPDDIEESPKVELDAVQKGFRERAAQEADRFSGVTDIGYYTCIVFENAEQNAAFLSWLGELGRNEIAVDGRVLADKIGLKLPPGGYSGGKPAKPDPKLAALAR